MLEATSVISRGQRVDPPRRLLRRSGDVGDRLPSPEVRPQQQLIWQLLCHRPKRQPPSPLPPAQTSSWPPPRVPEMRRTSRIVGRTDGVAAKRQGRRGSAQRNFHRKGVKNRGASSHIDRSIRTARAQSSDSSSRYQSHPVRLPLSSHRPSSCTSCHVLSHPARRPGVERVVEGDRGHIPRAKAVGTAVLLRPTAGGRRVLVSSHAAGDGQCLVVWRRLWEQNCGGVGMLACDKGGGTEMGREASIHECPHVECAPPYTRGPIQLFASRSSPPTSGEKSATTRAEAVK